MNHFSVYLLGSDIVGDVLPLLWWLVVIIYWEIFIVLSFCDPRLEFLLIYEIQLGLPKWYNSVSLVGDTILSPLVSECLSFQIKVWLYCSGSHSFLESSPVFSQPIENPSGNYKFILILRYTPLRTRLVKVNWRFLLLSEVCEIFKS